MKISVINFLEKSEDLQLKTLDWRNSQHVSMYFQLKNIDLETHKNWLEKLKEERPKTIAFFIEVDETPVGVTYFHSINYEHKVCDWGIYVYDPSLRGHGIGKKTLELSLGFAKNKLKMKEIYLEVLDNNKVAKKLYEKLFFVLLQKKDNVLRYKKEL